MTHLNQEAGYDICYDIHPQTCYNHVQSVRGPNYAHDVNGILMGLMKCDR